ncbi:LysR family transcriptional regulator [Actibacterium sp. 188UL27-1]|uniref:LysR family transcriptional regulator n=1 Tax=Actibacterium sp. 188UL27-1 TaxID=2786961 RepID=UPI0019584785|nr:LysR family transcriptional regulator [Actibacterium sp. 188UL27-1]MBM7066782.1 LysR family transcriptional regulator [Actibacterium sp. 188UL27-1]
MTNWNDYRFLLATDTFGSLAAAAQRLGVSQPTVSRRITALERALDLCLLERGMDGARLSEAGRRICDEARLLECQVAEIEMQARAVERAVATPVRLTASEGVTQALLTPVLAGLRLTHADITLDLSITNKIADLRRRVADVAVRIGDPMDDSLIGRRLGQVQFCLYAHEEYLTIRGTPATLADLEHHAVIESKGEIAKLVQVEALRDAAGGAQIAYASNTLQNQLVAVTSGFGIVALPRYLAAGRSGLRRILARDFTLTRDIWMLANPQTIDQPAVRSVVDAIVGKVPGLLKQMAVEPDWQQAAQI